VTELLDLLLSDREAPALGLAERALSETGSRAAVFADLLHPVQVEVGNRWYAGKASSADEVRVAAAVRPIVGRLRPTPPPSRCPTARAACSPSHRTIPTTSA
jgi:methanogenic corrinoid protein MtbC1